MGENWPNSRCSSEPHQCWKEPWGFNIRADLAQRGEGSSKVTHQSDTGQAFQAYPASLRGHVCYPWGMSVQQNHWGQLLFAFPLSGSAGTWVPFTSRLIILDRVFQSQSRSRRQRGAAQAPALPLSSVPAHSGFCPDGEITLPWKRFFPWLFPWHYK